MWRDWQKVIAPDNTAEILALEEDRGSYLGYVRLLGRRRAEARLDEPILSVPGKYAKKPCSAIPNSVGAMSGHCEGFNRRLQLTPHAGCALIGPRA